MKFEEAFDIAFKKEQEIATQKNAEFAISPATAKILAFFWNMLAAADGQLDDMVTIDNNNRIVSHEFVSKEDTEDAVTIPTLPEDAELIDLKQKPKDKDKGASKKPSTEGLDAEKQSK